MQLTARDKQQCLSRRKEAPSQIGINKAAREAGLKPATVHMRLSRGWGLEDALNTPPIPKDRQLEMARARIGRKKGDEKNERV